MKVLSKATKKSVRNNTKATKKPDSTHSIIMWINHLDFLPGDKSVRTSFNGNSSGPGPLSLSGLMITSITNGEEGFRGKKTVEKGLEVPPGYKIKGVRICYELTDSRSFISQITLAQLMNPPAGTIVKMDDSTHLTSKGPICIDSQQTNVDVDPSDGAVRLSLRVNFGDTNHKIVVIGVGLRLQ